MKDRELLELAANAAFAGFDEQMLEDGWNPLEDDGDALRLAVELCIPVWRDADVIWCNYMASVTGDDPYAATRRAIVRAAAEIGSRSNA